MLDSVDVVPTERPEPNLYRQIIFGRGVAKTLV